MRFIILFSSLAFFDVAGLFWLTSTHPSGALCSLCCFLSCIRLSDVIHHYKQITMKGFGMYYFSGFASSQKDKFYLIFLMDT